VHTEWGSFFTTTTTTTTTTTSNINTTTTVYYQTVLLQPFITRLFYYSRLLPDHFKNQGKNDGGLEIFLSTYNFYFIL
jgi:hypothetical protein